MSTSLKEADTEQKIHGSVQRNSQSRNMYVLAAFRECYYNARIG